MESPAADPEPPFRSARGRPAPPRRSGGGWVLALAGIGLLVVAVVIAAVVTKGNPLTPLLVSLSGDYEGPAPTRVMGRGQPYEIRFPDNKKWYLRKREITARENALADWWFVRPDVDAHVLIVAESAPGTPLPIDPYVDAVLGNVQKDTPGLTVYSREPWPAYPERGRLVKVRGSKGGISLEWHYAFVTAYDRAYYVLGLATQETMPSVEPEIRAIFDSLALPASVLDALPADVDPAKVTKVTGKVLPYSLTPPNDRWHFRNPDVVKKDNPIIDQWITRPEIDAHVLVIAEEVDKRLTLELGSYVEAVMTTAKKGTTKFEQVSREPWAKFPKDGVRIRVSLSRSGADLEYDYGLFARGNRAFQVVGFSSKMAFVNAKDDMARVIESFEPPPP